MIGTAAEVEEAGVAEGSAPSKEVGESSGAVAMELIELTEIDGVGSCVTPARRGDGR